MKAWMDQRREKFQSVRCVIFAAAMAVCSARSNAQWPQWGGPKRDFQAGTATLASQWPAEGPKRVWSRPLGEGYSGIIVEDGRLYTMYRTGDDEVVVALDGDTGKTLWEHKSGAPVFQGMETQFGRGPNATPLIHRGRLYAIGVAGHLQCLDAKTGTRIWSHEFMNAFGATLPEFGHSSSPMVYKNTLVTAVGGAGHGIMAFDLDSGSVVWQKHDFVNVYSSPILIGLDGEDQLVVLVDRAVVGLAPSTGDLLWSFPHENQWKTNISTPVWGNDHLLYVTTGDEPGSRALNLQRTGGETKVEEVWTTRKMAVGQGNVVRMGDYVYGSSGSEGPAFLTAVELKTGKVAWRERGFAKANLLAADGKLVILDEDGILAFAAPSPKELKILSKVQLLKKPAWTVPTLVGTRLYARDKETIMALDLG